jgi:hypothetical protein
LQGPCKSGWGEVREDTGGRSLSSDGDLKLREVIKHATDVHA